MRARPFPVWLIVALGAGALGLAYATQKTPADIRAYLEHNGYSDVHMEAGHRRCGGRGYRSFTFKAIAKSGRPVAGYVCSYLLLPTEIHEES